MATNRPLQSITLTSATQYVYFTNIPQNYTDLIVVASVRQTTANPDGYLRFNGDNSSIYADQVFRATGSAASATKDDSAAGIDIGVMPNSSSASGVYQAFTLNVMNYTSTNMYKSVFIRTGNDSYTHQLIGTWRSTDAITSLSLESRNAGYFAVGSTFDLYGIKSGAPKAFGGDVVATDGNYWYHAFKSTGTFTPQYALSCDVLVVAGGGGGGDRDLTGGGGAGGIFYATSQSVSVTGYTVTVGAGGAKNAIGSNSQFGSLTVASGGGRGGYPDDTAGGTGGSGGGAARATSVQGTPGSSNQSSTGGTGYGNAGGPSTPYASGGLDLAGSGGGAGAAGTRRTTSATPANNNGGIGLNTWSSWASATGTGDSGYFVGGGGVGGNSYAPGSPTGSFGGTGGGGRGGITDTNAGTAGTANTGGGGGGGASFSGAGAAGGSGIVIVRYAV